MRITALRELSIPLRADIANSVVNFSAHTVSLVAVVSDVVRNGKPVVGLAFDSIGRFAQTGILKDRFFPRLEETPSADLLQDDGRFFDASKVLGAIMRNEKPGGHGDRAHAAAAVELAIWDLNAKLADLPAWRYISDQFGIQPREEMPVYAAGGYYYPTDSRGRLADEMRHYGDLGYTRFKMKIGGASLEEDMARIEAALEVVGDSSHLAVDANGRFDMQTAIAYGRAMRDFGLRWYEEPGDPLDFDIMAALAKDYPYPLATGENLFSVRDVKNLVRYGGMRHEKDFFQIDPGLSYGLGEFVRIIEVMEEAGYSRRQLHPHGGHMLALHIVMGLNIGGSEAYPGVFAPVGGYTAGCRVSNGTVAPTAAPGFGLEEKDDLKPSIDSLVDA